MKRARSNGYQFKERIHSRLRHFFIRVMPFLQTRPEVCCDLEYFVALRGSCSRKCILACVVCHTSLAYSGENALSDPWSIQAENLLLASAKHSGTS